MPSLPKRCPRCRHTLRPNDDQCYAGTVLAERSHECAAVVGICAAANLSALHFSEMANFVSVRLVLPRSMTPLAWIALLEEYVTTCALAHQVVPSEELDGVGVPGFSLVISYRVGLQVDIEEVLEDAVRALRT